MTPVWGVVRQNSCCQLCRSTNVSCVHHLGFLRIPSLMLACCYCTMVKLTSTQPQCFHICSWALTDFPQQKNISGCSSSLFDSSKHVLVSPQTLHTNHCTHLLILVLDKWKLWFVFMASFMSIFPPPVTVKTLKVVHFHSLEYTRYYHIFSSHTMLVRLTG